MVLLVLSCVGLIISAHSFRDRTTQIRVAESDNGGWLIAQLDVDHKALNLAVDNILLKVAFEEFSEQPADMMQVHLRFDIFYSRVETVIASLQRTEVPITLTESLYDLDNARNRLTAQIEAINPADTSSIVKFANEVRNSAREAADLKCWITVGISGHSVAALAPLLIAALLHEGFDEAIQLLGEAVDGGLQAAIGGGVGFAILGAAAVALFQNCENAQDFAIQSALTLVEPPDHDNAGHDQPLHDPVDNLPKARVHVNLQFKG